MNLTFGLPVFFRAAALTWYGLSSLMRSSQTSLGSPIDTHTSVMTKSAPGRAFAGSSVRVILAPLAFARSLAIFWTSLDGHRSLGEQMRTSEPMIAPITSSELPMLERASPM